MGGQIFIESDDAEFVGVPVGAQHLYLVHRDTDGHEYVIRSGPSSSWWPFGTEMKVEANVPIERSEDARGDESPADRASTLLNFPDLTTDAAWAIMVKYARLIAAADYPYHLSQENSNAFVGAMLAAAGGDPGDLLPKRVDADEAVGISSFDEILDDIAPPPNGTLYGTEVADVLQGIQVGERIVAGEGNDIVRAGRGDDIVLGVPATTGLTANTTSTGFMAVWGTTGFMQAFRAIQRRPTRAPPCSPTNSTARPDATNCSAPSIVTCSTAAAARTCCGARVVATGFPADPAPT